MKRVIMTALWLLAARLCGAQETGALWDKADQAFTDLALEKSNAILENILRHPAAGVKDRAKAYRTLALRNWKYYRRYEPARRYLDSALAAPDSGNASWLAVSEVETGAGHYPAALAAGEKAIGLARNPTEFHRAAIAFAGAVYQLSLEKYNPDSALLSKATGLLVQVLQQMPGHPQAALLLMNNAILKKDGPLLLAGWNAYFHFDSADSAYAYLKGAADTLSNVLAHWQGDALPAADAVQLIGALARSGFYRQAGLLTRRLDKKTLQQHRRIRHIAAYTAYLNDLETLTNEYYRQIATGRGNGNAYEQALLRRSGLLLQQLQVKYKSPLTFDDFLLVIGPRFGAAGFLGTTSSFNAKEIALGHIVNVETKEVLQYGYKGSLTFIQLDLMSSNGYISWLSDKSRGNGGWSVNDTIYQVRENYLDDPIEAWNTATDSAARREKESLFERTVLNPAVQDTTEILEGIAARLRLDAVDSLYQSLHRQGLRGSQLQRRFMTGFERLYRDASIFAHEGRHSIDQIHFQQQFQAAPNSEREYRAKLSEIACADFGRYILGGIVNRIGASGHGTANRMITADALAWLDKHKHEVPGYSDKLPLIKQLYLLSDSQLKACFREADPLYKRLAAR